MLGSGTPRTSLQHSSQGRPSTFDTPGGSMKRCKERAAGRLRQGPYANRHSAIDKIWQRWPGSSPGFIETHKLRLPARARTAGTSIANVTDVALKKLRDGWGNGGSADHCKTERSDRQSNKKAEGDEATGAASSPLVSFESSSPTSIKPAILFRIKLDPSNWTTIGSLHPSIEL